MRALYTIFLHDNGENVIYHGIAVTTIQVSEYLMKQGLPIRQPNVMELVNERQWSTKVIIIRHLVEEEVLLTPDLLTQLRFNGEREAERLLKNRNKTKHEK